MDSNEYVQYNRFIMKNKNVRLIHLYIAVALVGVFFVFRKAGCCSIPHLEIDPLRAGVYYTGTQFEVENRNDYNWTDVIISINGKKSIGYVFKTRVMPPGETLTIGAANFCDSRGTRFNPFTQKPLEVWVYANTPHGLSIDIREWK